MKRYETYRHIRGKALIYGLPIGGFAIMMLAIVGTLMGIIFSFSAGMLITGILFDLALYGFLVRLAYRPDLLVFRKVFPRMITNRKTSGWHYED